MKTRTKEYYIKWLHENGQELRLRKIDGIEVEVIHHRWDKSDKYDILTTPSLIKLLEHKKSKPGKP